MANIRKLGLNEQDSKILEDLLSDSKYYTPLQQKCITELRKQFNQIINKPDINRHDLKALFTGEESEFCGWVNRILENPFKCHIVFDKLKTMNPKDLEIFKRIDDDALKSLYEYGDFMLPDKYIKKLSGLLKKDDTYISEVYSKDLNRRIVEFYGKGGDKTYFKYDPKKEALVLFKKDGTKELVKERIFIKDAIGKPTEMIAMLKRVPADELLAINKNGIKQILKGSISSSSTLFESENIATIPNEFVFLHELGHQKDMVKNIISAEEKEYVGKMHKGFRDFVDDKFECQWYADDIEYINGEWRYKPGKGPTEKQIEKQIEEQRKIAQVAGKLEKLLQNKIAQISTNKDLLKIFNKERAAYIKKFGSGDERIDYFIKLGSGLGCEGEAVAEINALLSTPTSEAMLGTRSYLLAENFPETIAYARNLLFI